MKDKGIKEELMVKIINSSGPRLFKRSCIYELNTLGNSCVTAAANIRATHIYELICNIRARTLLVKRVHVSVF